MITIIVPIYNGAQFLDKCVQSILHQNSKDWELLLIDDGSTDDTPQICQKYLGDGRVHYFRKENSGVQDTRWYGLEQATSDYVTFLDADDILLPSTIEILHRHLGESDILAFGMQMFDKENDIKDSKHEVSVSDTLNDKIAIIKSILCGKMLSCVWGGVYKRKMLLRCKDIFCNKLKIGEDTMFNTEFVYSMSPSVAVLPLPLYCYRTNLNSVSHTYDDRRHKAVYDTIKYLEDFLLRSGLAKTLRAEGGFRLLLLWSSFMFHPNNKYYLDKALRRKMKKLYLPAFRYLYPYLKVYLFIDLFIHKLEKKWK